MTILRITGATSSILKVHHTKYLRDAVGMGLSAAKHITDDILEGRPRDIEVSDELAELHRITLGLLGAKVEIAPREEQAADAA